MDKLVQLGPRTIPMTGLGHIVIRTDAPFTVYEVHGEDHIPVGPDQENNYVARFDLTGNQDSIRISTDDTTAWMIAVHKKSDGREVLDLTPVESTVDVPKTIREEMKDYIRTILAMQEEERQGAEDFDEANDFDIDDDNDLDLDWDSKYELMEMIDEVIEEDNPQESQEAPQDAPEEKESQPTDPPPKDA